MVNQKQLVRVAEIFAVELLGPEPEQDAVVAHHAGVTRALSEVDRDLPRRAEAQLYDLRALRKRRRFDDGPGASQLPLIIGKRGRDCEAEDHRHQQAGSQLQPDHSRDHCSTGLAPRLHCRQQRWIEFLDRLVEHRLCSRERIGVGGEKRRFELGVAGSDEPNIAPDH
jgi:hypothetical protein